MQRYSRRILGIIGGMAIILALALTVPVAAHAQYKSSVPPANGTVPQAPGQVVITFSEETDPLKSGGSVTDASGVLVSTGFKVDLNERTQMAIALKPNLPNGIFTVKWNTFTDDDNGVGEGTFTFTIQAAATGSNTTIAGSPVSGTAASGAAVTTVQPTAAPTATVAPSATPAAIAAVATSIPATPTPANQTTTTSGTPWLVVAIVVIVVGGVGGAAWAVMRRRTASRL